MGVTSGVGTNRWLKYTVEQIPIPPIDNDEKWDCLIDNIINSNDKGGFEKQIDQIVYSQYGLTTEEVNYIERGGL